MEVDKKRLLAGLFLIIIIFFIPIYFFLPDNSVQEGVEPWNSVVKKRNHLDHSAYFKNQFKNGREVTKTCLECHEDAAHELMKTAHWNWEGEPVHVPGHKGKIKIGKKNLVNNFCIGITGNWGSCTSCHIGYGWTDENFDFKKQENVDCLVCHDWTGAYAKGTGGLPKKGVNLLSVAKSVGYPKRENCGICHIYGGGGMGVKHGDLDSTLVNPSEVVDVHMGKHKLLCIDCHKTKKHNITGKAFSVSVNHDNGINCTDCHGNYQHDDSRINTHLDSLACQTCHISTYAKRAPTKTEWDWSKAGDSSRKDDIHKYLKIKGEFIYEQNIVPEYFWFNLTTDRYLLGDKFDPKKTLAINNPRGNIRDKNSKIWPFKVHRAKQPYDIVNHTLMQPYTSGEGGFWHDFNWDKAFKLGAKATGQKYSGKYGFIDTEMFWPLSHMVSPKDKVLLCCDCHGENSRMNWKALGYERDPVDTGGRKDNVMMERKGGKK